jgi:carnosine N-methyltransferase
VKELKRLLSTDGIFIHFGPFNYHFKEITNMLSVEEVKQYFKLQGFELLTEDNIIAEHLSAEDGIKLNVFINQLLVFRLK